MIRDRLGILCWLALITCTEIFPPGSAFGATNSATGGIGGLNNGTLIDGDGTGAARFTINSLTLALIKQARDTGGLVLPDGADVYPGQEIYFVLYVDNPTAFVTDDIRISDAIDESQFTYVTDTLEEALVPSGSDDGTIWAGPWTPLTDQLGAPDDPASILDTGGPSSPDLITVGMETGQVNQRFTLPGGSLGAVRFRVRVN
jgi:hypothetical protein